MFLHQELGWGQTKVDELLLPIIQKMNRKRTSTASGMQGSLSEWVSARAGNSSDAANLAPRKKEVYTSRRLQQVVADFRKRRKAGSVVPSQGGRDDDQDQDDGADRNDDEPVKKRQRKAKSNSRGGKNGRGRGRGRGGATSSNTRKSKAGGGGDDDDDYNEGSGDGDDANAPVVQPASELRPRPRPRPRPVRKPSAGTEVGESAD